MEDEKGKKFLSEDEIKEVVASGKRAGLRFTVDLYLLDYIKHCFLEDDQLENNIQKLRAGIDVVKDSPIKSGLQEVLSCLQCVKKEYDEYLEDTKIMAQGKYPSPRADT